MSAMDDTTDAESATIACALSCKIPPGVKVVETPPTRYAWSDVAHCPNEGCERTFLVTQLEIH